jgi:hypothetical protein
MEEGLSTSITHMTKNNTVVLSKHPKVRGTVLRVWAGLSFRGFWCWSLVRSVHRIFSSQTEPFISATELGIVKNRSPCCHHLQGIWRHYVPLKQWHVSTKACGVIIPKAHKLNIHHEVHENLRSHRCFMAHSIYLML